MEPLYGILLVAFVAVVAYAVAAVTLVRRNKETPSPPWSRLKGFTWLAVASAVVILLSLAAALVVTIAGMAGSPLAQLAFGFVTLIIVGAFYLFLVHPLVRVVRAKGVPGQEPERPNT